MIRRFISVLKWPYQGLVLPRLQAHRGYWKGGIQENTLEAFREARIRGALKFECDVRLSKDQIPIVFHDENLQRIGGFPYRVEQLTARELKQKVNAPSLKEVLTDSHVPRFVNIEFKTKRKLDDPLERKVADVVKLTKAENRVLFSSFNPVSLYRISLHLPHVPRALLVTQEDDPENHVILKHMLLAPFLDFHLLHLHYKMITEENMKIWKSRRIPITAWTVNGSSEIQKYINMGCVSIITDTI